MEREDVNILLGLIAGAVLAGILVAPWGLIAIVAGSFLGGMVGVRIMER